MNRNDYLNKLAANFPLEEQTISLIERIIVGYESRFEQDASIELTGDDITVLKTSIGILCDHYIRDSNNIKQLQNGGHEIPKYTIPDKKTEFIGYVRRARRLCRENSDRENKNMRKKYEEYHFRQAAGDILSESELRELKSIADFLTSEH
ncbi:MAG: hypothetical protein AABX24_02645 [Nanoarchaeota archaeon]